MSAYLEIIHSWNHN